MLGIEDIAVYLPKNKLSNQELCARFAMDEAFLRDKIGVANRTVRDADENTSHMAHKALELLLAKTGVWRESIQVLVVVTQNPDSCLPHVSGLVHGMAGLESQCAAFDLSLGCSGFVYGLSVVQAFMAANGLTKGVLITCDPYSKIIDPEDRNTVPLFGDAATATMIGIRPLLVAESFVFGTQGDLGGALVCRDGQLHMNGRDVFNFAATKVPPSVAALLEKVGASKEDIDCFLFHQGSRYIVETLAKRIGVPADKVRIDIENTGNTVSSSIPLLLEKELDRDDVHTMVLSGFGVGLSWASCLCKRVRLRGE